MVYLIEDVYKKIFPPNIFHLSFNCTRDHRWPCHQPEPSSHSPLWPGIAFARFISSKADCASIRHAPPHRTANTGGKQESISCYNTFRFRVFLGWSYLYIYICHKLLEHHYSSFKLQPFDLMGEELLRLILHVLILKPNLKPQLQVCRKTTWAYNPKFTRSSRAKFDQHERKWPKKNHPKRISKMICIYTLPIKLKSLRKVYAIHLP